MVYYTETQTVAFWVFILLAGIFVLTVFLPLCSGQTGRQQDGEGLVAALLAVFLLPLVANLLCLRTEVRQDVIYLRLGFLFPMMWRRIPLDTVVSVEAVRYRPIRDAGGWGYRYGRYDGRSCWYYTMRGNRGVYILDADNRQHIVGSQDPERLAAAIRTALVDQGLSARA